MRISYPPVSTVSNTHPSHHVHTTKNHHHHDPQRTHTVPPRTHPHMFIHPRSLFFQQDFSPKKAEWKKPKKQFYCKYCYALGCLTVLFLVLVSEWHRSHTPITHTTHSHHNRGGDYTYFLCLQLQQRNRRERVGG